jgi:hypothetical protein
VSRQTRVAQVHRPAAEDALLQEPQPQVGAERDVGLAAAEEGRHHGQAELVDQVQQRRGQPRAADGQLAVGLLLEPDDLVARLGPAHQPAPRRHRLQRVGEHDPRRRDVLAGELRLHLVPVGPLRRRPELLHDVVEAPAEQERRHVAGLLVGEAVHLLVRLGEADAAGRVLDVAVEGGAQGVGESAHGEVDRPARRYSSADRADRAQDFSKTSRPHASRLVSSGIAAR